MSIQASNDEVDRITRQCNHLCKQFVYGKLRRFGLLNSKVFVAGILTALRFPARYGRSFCPASAKTIRTYESELPEPSNISLRAKMGFFSCSKPPEEKGPDDIQPLPEEPYIADAVEEETKKQSDNNVDEGDEDEGLKEVTEYLTVLGLELERRYPHLYTERICRRMNIDLGEGCTGNRFGSLLSDGSPPLHLQEAIITVASNIFADGHVTWGRVVALYGVCGALAVDCVRQGKEEMLGGLVDLIVGVMLDRGVVAWISNQGGWGNLVEFGRGLKTTNNDSTLAKAESHSDVFLCCLRFGENIKRLWRLSEEVVAKWQAPANDPGSSHGEEMGKWVMWVVSILVVIICFLLTSILLTKSKTNT